MYDIVSNIIGHEWVSNYSGEQQYIYYVCCALIPLFAVVIIDIIRGIFSSFVKS